MDSIVGIADHGQELSQVFIILLNIFVRDGNLLDQGGCRQWKKQENSYKLHDFGLINGVPFSTKTAATMDLDHTANKDNEAHKSGIFLLLEDILLVVTFFVVLQIQVWTRDALCCPWTSFVHSWLVPLSYKYLKNVTEKNVRLHSRRYPPKTFIYKNIIELDGLYGIRIRYL